MSLKIIKAGILDTIQDLGRYGYQHLGINPGGAMDLFSASLANALLGKALNSPLIEMHFPASQILFERPCIICVTGADFTATINDNEVLQAQPVFINSNSILSFKRKKQGARCYLSLLNNLHVEPWLNGYSTNIKARAGGYKGRKLENNDMVAFDALSIRKKTIANTILPWRYNPPTPLPGEMQFLPGSEWNWLSTKSQTAFLNDSFQITPASDRMGYRLRGDVLEQGHIEQLISSAVNFGTIQLLPNGQLIILMADHQTTGGYPKIGNVISASLPKLAQMNAGPELKFTMTDIKTAEEKWMEQQNYLQRLQNTCNLKMQNWLNAH